MANKRKALAELANELVGCANILLEEGWVSSGRAVTKACCIIAELSREFEPIDENSVEPSVDGRKHLTDFIKACDNRRCEIMIKCRAIAEEE